MEDYPHFWIIQAAHFALS